MDVCGPRPHPGIPFVESRHRIAIETKEERRICNLRFVSDITGDFTRSYVSPKDEDVPGFSVFSKRDGTVRHFYSGEMFTVMGDPGQDPRGAPDADPLWSMLDLTPQGRGTDWYPKLDYKQQNSK